MREELGVAGIALWSAGSFVYRAPDPVSGLVEWEFDRVFWAVTDDTLVPALDEVDEVRALRASELASVRLTPWAITVVERAVSARRKRGRQSKVGDA